MKKLTKILAVVIALVMVTTVLCACGLSGRNTAKYRAATAVKVGDQEISVGRILDAFNNAYYQYYSYISYGYMTVEQLFDMVMSSLYQQYMEIDSYVHNSASAKFDHTSNYVKGFKYSDFLSDDEMDYVIRYVKYSMYVLFDNYVDTYAEVDYTLGEVEGEDTSRDFTEFDDWGDADSYALYQYNQHFVNDEMDDYLNDYYGGTVAMDSNSYSDYVFASETEGAKAKIQALNDRINEGMKDEDGFTKNPVTFDTYKAWQEKAVKAYEKTVKSSYGMNLEQFVGDQITSTIQTIIAYKYDYQVAKAIESDKSALEQTLSAAYNELASQAATDYKNDSTFISAIEGLGSTSYVYNVPAKFDVNNAEGGIGNGYVFTKNILVKFSQSQLNYLANYAKAVGGKDTDAYKAEMVKVAANIVATDYNSEKDADGNYAKVENLFKLDGDKLVINESGALAQYLANGQVTAMEGKTKDETIVELMKQYNEDVASHTGTYDYAVRIGDTESSYTPQMVAEYVEASKEAYQLNSNGGTYAVCVSTYGVHIVYYTKPVMADVPDFGAGLTDTSSVAYRFFVNYYNNKVSKLNADDESALKTSFAGKISKTSAFDKFIEENNIPYDFDTAIAE